MCGAERVRAPKDASLELVKRVRMFDALQQSEQRFILKTWLVQHRRFTKTPPDKLRARILDIFERPTTTVIMLLFPEDGIPEEQWRIVGFCVRTTGGAVHFVYVRSIYRSLGLAGIMLPKMSYVPCTHWAKKLPMSGRLFLVNSGRALEYVGYDPIPLPNHGGEHEEAPGSLAAVADESERQAGDEVAL